MKIYSNRLTDLDVHIAFAAARLEHGADIEIDEIRTWKPREYANGIEVWAKSLNGKLATGHVPARASGPRDGYPRAASWDDWGWVITLLFSVDPHARIGFYNNESDFIAKVRKYPRKGSALAFLDVLGLSER